MSDNELKWLVKTEDMSGPVLESTKKLLNDIADAGLKSDVAMGAAGKAVAKASEEFGKLIESGKASAEELKRTEDNVKLLNNQLEDLKKKAGQAEEPLTAMDAVLDALQNGVGGSIGKIIGMNIELHKLQDGSATTADKLRMITGAVGALSDMVSGAWGRMREAISRSAADGDESAQAMMGAMAHIEDKVDGMITMFTNQFAPAIAGIAQAISPVIDEMGAWLKENDAGTKVSLLLIDVLQGSIFILQALGEAYRYVADKANEWRYMMGRVTADELNAQDEQLAKNTSTLGKLADTLGALHDKAANHGKDIDEMVKAEALWAKSKGELMGELRTQMAAENNSYEQRLKMIRDFQEKYADIISNDRGTRLALERMAAVEMLAIAKGSERDRTKAAKEGAKDRAKAAKDAAKEEIAWVKSSISESKAYEKGYNEWKKDLLKEEEKAEENASKARAKVYKENERNHASMMKALGKAEDQHAKDVKKDLADEIKARQAAAKQIQAMTAKYLGIITDENMSTKDKLKAISQELTQKLLEDAAQQVMVSIEAATKKKFAALTSIPADSAAANAFLPFPASQIATAAAIAALTILSNKVIGGFADGGTLPGYGMQDSRRLGQGSMGMPGEEVITREVSEKHRQFLKDLNRTNDLNGSFARASGSSNSGGGGNASRFEFIFRFADMGDEFTRMMMRKINVQVVNYDEPLTSTHWHSDKRPD